MERNRPLFIVSNLAVILGISILVLSGLIFVTFNTPTGFFDGTISGFSTADLNDSTTNNAAVNLSGFEQGTAVVGQDVEWINLNTSEIVTTAAPEVSETTESEVEGKLQKKVTVASEFHYQKVLTYASIPDLTPDQVKLYWMIDGVKTDITEREEFNLTFYDENNDELIDKISWITPHLSIQEFILEFDITVINPWEFGESGGEWIVYFNTTGTGTLNITKDNLSNSVLTFNYLRCGTTNIPYTLVGQSYVVENYTCSETSLISHTIGDMPDEIFSMRFDFGNDLQNDVDFAYDPAVCIPWPTMMPGEPDCSACGFPAFLGFDMDPAIDGACYSDHICSSPCGGGGPPPNNAPQWSQAINNSGAIEDSGTSIPDTDLTAAGNGRCQDGDGDPLTFILTAENTSQVDCTIDGSQLNITPAADWYGNGSSCEVTCDDGTDNAATTVSLNITGVNDAPTAPSLSLSPATIYVYQTLTASASGSTDPESDTLSSYYYEFYNKDDATTVQSYSTTATYTIQETDDNDEIRVRSKVDDGVVNSSETTTLINVTDSVLCGDTLSASTTLNHNITSCTSNNFLTISGNDRVIDCDGYMIQGTVNTAFYLGTGNSGATIKNCNIKLNGTTSKNGIVGYTASGLTVQNNTINVTSHQAIYLGTRSSNSTIQGNTFIGDNSNPLVYLINEPFNITVRDNTFTEGNRFAIRYYNGSKHNQIINNTITTSSYGIQLYSGAYNTTIENNTVTCSGNYCIQISGNASENTIFNNTLINGGYSLSLKNNVTKNTIYNNTISTNSSDGTRAVRFTNASHNRVYNNTLTTFDIGIQVYLDSINNSFLDNSITATDDIGIEIHTRSSNNTVAGNTITVSDDYGIRFLIGSSDNLAKNNIITVTDAYALSFETNSKNNIAWNNNLSTNRLAIRDVTSSTEFNALVYNNSNAEIHFNSTSLNEAQGGTLGLGQNISLSSNEVFVNITHFPALNQSAIITLFGTDALGFATRKPYQDGTACDSSICTEISDADTYIFNVTTLTTDKRYNFSVGADACMSATGNVFDISADTSCSSETISDANSELRLGDGNLKLDKGEFKYSILNMTDDSNSILNISGSNFTTVGVAEIKNRLIVNSSRFNISEGVTYFYPGSRATFINSTLITNNSIIQGSFDIDPSNWTNYGKLTVNNTVNITDTTLNVTENITVLTSGWLNITNSTIYSKGTNVTGNVTVDPSTWEEHGDLIIEPGGLMDFIDTGVIVHGKVIVDGGTLNFLLDSVLQMNVDNAPPDVSDITVQDIDPFSGLLYIDPSSRMERNSTTNYNVTVKNGGELRMYGNATDIENLFVSSNSLLTFNAAPSMEVEGNTSLDGTLTMASSHFVSNGTGTLSITGANFHNLSVRTGTTTLGSTVTIDNVFLVPGTLTTSNYDVTSPNIDLDGTINAGSSVITINGNANMTGGTYTSGTSKLILGGTSVFNPGDNTFDRLNVSSGNNVRQFGNATINQLFCPLGVYNVSGAAELILNRSKQVCSTKAYWNISLHNGKIINASINGTNITHINGSNVVIHPISSFILDSGNFRNVSAYANITESSGTSVVNINLSYNDDDVNDVSESTIKISRYTGSAWSQVTGSTLNTATNIISATLSTFSLFGGGGHEKSVSISLSTNLSSNLGWTVSNTTGLEWLGHNNNGTGPSGYYINISANQTAVNLTIKASAALTSGANTIPLANFNYSHNNSDRTVPGGNKSISTTATSIGNQLANKSVTWLKFFLTVPTRQAAGNYTNTVTIAATAS